MKVRLKITLKRERTVSTKPFSANSRAIVTSKCRTKASAQRERRAKESAVSDKKKPEK